MMLAKSLQSAAGNAAGEGAYIEDVFSTYLYTGAGAAGQTITNGIDLAGEGGLIWIKRRDGVRNHYLHDTDMASNNSYLSSNLDSALASTAAVTPNNDGFSIAAVYSDFINATNDKFVSWTFRKQEKFFQVVTWSGNSTARSIAHNLGSVPGCIIVKILNKAGENWVVWHRSINQDSKTQLFLNTSDAAVVGGKLLWGASGTNANMTSTTFSVGTATETNQSGYTYVAYLFAHDAEGFGESGEGNAISCGSVSYDSSATSTINLGYEPQWVMLKNTSDTSNWYIVDTMRGFTVNDGVGATLNPNLSEGDYPGTSVALTNTGFTIPAGYETTGTWIYVAIRRGPMKVPESGTSVFEPVTYSGDSSAPKTIGGSTIVSDIVLWANRFATAGNGTARPLIGPRLVGGNIMQTSNTRFEDDYLGYLAWGRTQLGVDLERTSADSNVTGESYILYLMRRAPSFFDVVCYTGTGSATTQTHNLQAVPELIIVKKRNVDSTTNWYVYSAALGNTQVGVLSGTNAFFTSSSYWNNTTPTSSVFSLGSGSNVNQSGTLFVSYLFASCPGVSKVGSYTGNGTAGNAITTGFAPRFLMIKCTNTAAGWIVFDSARGMAPGNDPSLYLNSTAAEITGTDWLDVSSTGFSLNTTGSATNSAGRSYIFLAIA